MILYNCRWWRTQEQLSIIHFKICFKFEIFQLIKHNLHASKKEVLSKQEWVCSQIQHLLHKVESKHTKNRNHCNYAKILRLPTSLWVWGESYNFHPLLGKQWAIFIHPLWGMHTKFILLTYILGSLFLAPTLFS